MSDDSDRRDRDLGSDRRNFLTAATSVAMASGLVAGYGAFCAISGRYLFPAKPRRLGWMFVVRAAELPLGSSMIFRAPIGERIVVARVGQAEVQESFLALSSTCPHLGCQVRWEAQHDRFFCPCHNGTFDASGKATGGPPGEAGMSLPRYELSLDANKLLHILVPLDRLPTSGSRLARATDPAFPSRLGHDACLNPEREAERA